jgi:hypothetical protein
MKLLKWKADMDDHNEFSIDDTLLDELKQASGDDFEHQRRCLNAFAEDALTDIVCHLPRSWSQERIIAALINKLSGKHKDHEIVLKALAAHALRGWVDERSDPAVIGAAEGEPRSGIVERCSPTFEATTLEAWAGLRLGLPATHQ